MTAIDVTAGLDGYRVTIRGRVYAEFATLSNAARCLNALEELERLGALPTSRRPALRLVTPETSPHTFAALRASVDLIDREKEA